MRFDPLLPREIVAVRMRLNWRSRPVLQCQRALVRMRISDEGVAWDERAGETQFRDVTKHDVFEVWAFMNCQNGVGSITVSDA